MQTVGGMPGCSNVANSKRLNIIFGILLSIFIITTIVLAAVYAREKGNKTTSGIDLMMHISNNLV